MRFAHGALNGRNCVIYSPIWPVGWLGFSQGEENRENRDEDAVRCPVIRIYGPGGALLALNLFGSGEGAIAIVPENTITGTIIYPQIAASAAGSGNAEYLALEFASGSPAAAQSAKMILFGRSADLSTSISHVSWYGSSSGNLIADLDQSGMAPADPVATGIREDWHTAGAPSGWTGSTRVKKNMDNGFWVQSQLAITSGSISGTLAILQLPDG